MIIRDERLHMPIQRGFVEDNQMVQTLTAEGADQAFYVCPLPRRSRGRKDFLDAHILELFREVGTEDPIAIPQQISWCSVPRKCVAELLCGPFRGGMGRDAEVEDPAALVSQHEEYVQDLKPDAGYGEEVDGHLVLT